ncbi:MAG: RluA family pseudouridine synthase [Lachnospiraceae bacterium]|nr:RluA family pseudouridine synthase [Lachnospiraceae bacterium]
MERIFQYTITSEYENKPIDFYLKSMGFSSQNIIELKKMPESILLNGLWVYTRTLLHTGDSLTIHLSETSTSDKIKPVLLPFPIVYEDEDILVVNKPADMPIHPSQNNYENTLANAAAFYFTTQNIPFTFRCINRLDRNTTGLTVIAKHMVSANILGKMVADKTLEREYLAICTGNPQPSEGIIEKPIGRVQGSTIERCIDFEHGDYAVTRYKVLETGADFAFLSLVLGTGRTHQIRVHMASIGHPLLGDSLYNAAPGQKIKRQALHSYRLSFPHPITGQSLVFTAPIPDDFLNLGIHNYH